MLKGEFKIASATSDPTPDGVGHTYYNSSSGVKRLRTWNGSAWKEYPPIVALPDAVNDVGGLRLAWDFDKTACYDGSTQAGGGVHTDFRIVKNIAPDSPNNSVADGGWIVDPRFIIRDSDTTASGSWDGDDVKTQDRKVFRPMAHTGVHGNGNVHSPFDPSASHSNATKYYGTEMVPNESINSGSDIKAFYHTDNPTAQDDNVNIGTWVMFMRFHRYVPTNVNNFYSLISYNNQASTVGEGFTLLGVMAKSGTHESTADRMANCYPASTAHATGADFGGPTAPDRIWANQAGRAATGGSDWRFDFATLTGTDEDWNDNFNMYTFESHDGTAESAILYHNDNNTAIAGVGTDWQSGYTSTSTITYYNPRSGGHASYPPTPYYWTGFGGGWRNAIRNWSDRGDSDWLYSATANSYGDRYPFPADIAVVLYYNKALSDANREAIYDAYKSDFGLPD